MRSTSPGSLLDRWRWIAGEVPLFVFVKLESNGSSEMNEFEGNHFPEPYLPNKQ